MRIKAWTNGLGWDVSGKVKASIMDADGPFPMRCRVSIPPRREWRMAARTSTPVLVLIERAKWGEFPAGTPISKCVSETAKTGEVLEF